MERKNVGAPFVRIRRRTDTTVPEMKNRGITLIALIITIIIMLILAGVVITLTIGEHGLIGRAQTAGQNYLYAQEKEENELAKVYEYIDSSRDNITLTQEEYNKLPKKYVINSNISTTTSSGIYFYDLDISSITNTAESDGMIASASVFPSNAGYNCTSWRVLNNTTLRFLFNASLSGNSVCFTIIK